VFHIIATFLFTLLPVLSLRQVPTNQYRYIQMRQRTLYYILPVHTHAEYYKFKSIINDKQYRLPGAATKPHTPHEAWKDVDYDILTWTWNSDVEKQDHLPSHRTLDPTPGGTNRQDGPPMNSSEHIYYKIPGQLKSHHKTHIKFNTAHATMLNGLNATSLKSFTVLLNDTIPDKTLPGIPLELDLSVHMVDGKLMLHMAATQSLILN